MSNTKQNNHLITSQEELDKLIKKKQEKNVSLECYVLLNFGLRSSKDISFCKNGDYFVVNEIDGSEETIKHGELTNSFIGKALNNKALYIYD